MSLFAIEGSALELAISHVIRLRSQEQMLRVEASGIVTAMQNHSCIVFLNAKPKDCSYSMSQEIAATESKVPVTSRVFGVYPIPATCFDINDSVLGGYR